MMRKKYFTVNKLLIFLLTTTLLGIIYVYISMYIYKILPNQNLNIINQNVNNTNIVLFTPENKKFNIDTKLTQKDWSIIYFGCIQSCDMFMRAIDKMREIKKILQQQNLKVQILFVTLDPARDNKILLKKVFSEYEDITALTGKLTEIKKMTRLLKVNFTKSEKIDETNYIIDHPRVINIINKNFAINKQFDLLSDNSEIIEFIQNHAE